MLLDVIARLAASILQTFTTDNESFTFLDIYFFFPYRKCNAFEFYSS